MSSREENEAFCRQMALFLPNREAFPLEELDRYQDQYVAFNPEGTKIIAATAQLDTIFDLIRAAGYDPANCPIEFVP
jgi:hypothetical protein